MSPEKLGFILLGLLVILAVLFLPAWEAFEKRVAFPRPRVINATPADFGIPYEDLWFEASDGVRLNGWFIPLAGARLTVLYFHGNGENIGDFIQSGMYHAIIRPLDADLFVFDYREYGRSGGEISEAGTYRDGEAAYHYLVTQKRRDPQEILFFGNSLGTAIAIDLAAKVACRGLILRAPLSSGKELAQYHLPTTRLLYALLPWLPRIKYDSVEEIKKVRVPLLILHGEADEVVPIRLGRKVFQAASEPKEFVAIPGESHNTLDVEKTLTPIQHFIKKLGERSM